MNSTSVSENRPQLSIIARPQGQLHDYPIDVRWEVTRRHPYYLVFWEDALNYRKELPGDWRSPETWLRYAAVLMLGNIGVSGEPVPPDTDAKQLNEGVPDPAFLTGSVQPLSIRAIVVMLINGLPPAERVRIGQLLSNAGSNDFAIPEDDENRNLQMQMELALGDLARLPNPILNRIFDVPVFYVHLGASQRSIVRDMEDQARRWKERRKIGSSKVQTAKLVLQR